MANNERDTHFQGFAKLLWEDLETTINDHYGFIPEGERLRRDFLPLMYTLIAQRAYDLVEHALEAVPDIIPEVQSLKASLEAIPDLTQWPPS